ncbi:MAG TPA: DUF4382 domain-containing protein [Gemmatimonadales bacterium]
MTTITRSIRWAVLAAATLAAGACGDGQPTEPADRFPDDTTGQVGLTRVYLTDAPFPFESVASVNVYIVGILASTTTDTAGPNDQDWVTIATPARRFNLLDLQNGTTALVGAGDLPAGLYKAIRMIVNTDSSSVIYNDGSAAPVNWQVAGEQVLNAFVEAPLDVPEDGADIIIDFDGGRSFLWLNNQFVFIPWFRAVNEAATGSIAGRVQGLLTVPGTPEPIPNASVAVMQGDTALGSDSWWVVATGRTDEGGLFAVHFLLPGAYIVQANPTAEFPLAAAGVYGGIPVSVGQTTSLDVVLPTGLVGPAIVVSGDVYAVVGDSAILHATVYDASNDTVVNPSVVWASRDPAVLTVNGSGWTVSAWAQAEGTSWIVATSGSLADSALVTVLADTSSGGSGPVATVTISPAAQTIAVGDSSGVSVTVRDSLGGILAGRAIAWSLSDSTLIEFGVGFSGTFALIRGLVPGTVIITALSEGKSGTATVTVTQ